MAAEGWQDEEFCGSMDLDLKSARINCDKLNRFMDFEIVPIALGLDWPEIHTLDLKLTSQIGFSSVLDDMESIPIISKKKGFHGICHQNILESMSSFVIFISRHFNGSQRYRTLNLTTASFVSFCKDESVTYCVVCQCQRKTTIVVTVFITLRISMLFDKFALVLEAKP